MNEPRDVGFAKSLRAARASDLAAAKQKDFAEQASRVPETGLPVLGGQRRHRICERSEKRLIDSAEKASVPFLAVRGGRESRDDAKIVAPCAVLEIEISEGMPPRGQHRLDGERRLQADGIERIAPEIREARGAARHRRLEEQFLAAEMIVDECDVNAGEPRNHPVRRRAEAVVGDQALRCIEQRVAGERAAKHRRAHGQTIVSIGRRLGCHWQSVPGATRISRVIGFDCEMPLTV